MCLCATYFINQSPAKPPNSKTSNEILFGVAPSYAHLRTFGCLCYAHDHNQIKDKFDEQSMKCISLQVKGWRVYDVERK